LSPSACLRRALASDVEALCALEAESSPHPWSEGQLRAEVLRAPPDAVLVLESRAGRGEPGTTRIVAYGAFRVVLDELHVLNVAVLPELRRRGLARWLLEFALGRAARAGARHVWLEARAGNAPALALYEALGFERRGLRRDYYRKPAEDAILLGRELVPARPAVSRSAT
jgi:ribosomal-protein-alanine N-acetyltransferase